MAQEQGADGVEVKAKADFSGLKPPPQEPYNEAKQLGDVRSELAIALFGLFAATIAAAFITIWHDDNLWVHTRDIFTVALAAETGLLGSAVGFYFGAKK